MPKDTEINLQELFTAEAEQPLRSFLGNVVKGYSEVVTTPFAEGETTEELLSNWREYLDQLNNDWPTLVEFEDGLAEKVGPLSVKKPLSERIPDIEAYYDGILLPSEPIIESAVRATISEWGSSRGLHLRDQRQVVEYMKLSTNSGNPYFTKRRNVVDKTLKVLCSSRNPEQPVQMLRANSASTKESKDVWDAVAILGWRGQEGGINEEDVKQRVVFMFPFGVNVNELQVYQPAIETAQKFNIYPAWVSMDSVDRVITNLFDSKSDSDLIICTDFTKFDQHFNQSLQDAAYAIIEAILTPRKDSSLWLEQVYPIKYNIPLLCSTELAFYGAHGMGSGSGGTNFDETIAHRSLQYECAIRNGARLNPHSQCLGDDGILSFPNITVDKVIDSYTRHGLEMNDTKQYESQFDCVYLRRWHHKDYRVNGICAGVYSTMRALGRLRYMERFVDLDEGYSLDEFYALRQLSILENCKFHPLKEEFVQFCMKRDKYRLGLDLPGFFDKLALIAGKFIDYMPDFLGYTKSMQGDADQIIAGMSRWWVVRYLKSLK